MIPVTQSKVGASGTCFRSCLASILELQEHEVPDINDFTEAGFTGAVNDFLHEHGLRYRRVPIDGAKPSGYSTVEGVSPRGGLHACVAYDGELVHDPHPQDGTGRGLVEPRYYGLLEKLGGRAADSSGFTCRECGGPVSRRYKNNTCQHCLAKRHEDQRAALRPLEAEVEAARGNLDRYQAAVKALKSAKQTLKEK